MKGVEKLHAHFHHFTLCSFSSFSVNVKPCFSIGEASQYFFAINVHVGYIFSFKVFYYELLISPYLFNGSSFPSILTFPQY